METTANIVHKDPTDLRLHKLQAHIPAPDKKSPEWVAFIDSIHAGGILQPLIITNDGQVMDGGWRWRAAKQLELDEVPCLIRGESEAAVIITESLLHRKQMTRGAAVYLALSLMEEFVESAESRRRSNLMRGHKTREIPLKSPNPTELGSEGIVELCQRWGVSEETYRRAAKVRRLFHDTKCADIAQIYTSSGLKVPALEKLQKFQSEMRADLEPKLLSGEKSTWNVISSFGGALPEFQDAKAASQSAKQMEFWDSPFEPLRKAAPAWKHLPIEKRESVIEEWRKTLLAMPVDLRRALTSALKEGQ